MQAITWVYREKNWDYGITPCLKLGLPITPHLELGLWDNTPFEIGITGLQDAPFQGPRKGIHYTVNILGSSALLKRSSTLLKIMDPASNLILTQDPYSALIEINLDHRYHQYILINVECR